MQFLVGSAHILNQPLFRRACEAAFSESDIDEDDSISMQEVIIFSIVFIEYVEITISIQFNLF